MLKQCPICGGVLQDGWLHTSRGIGLAFVLDVPFTGWTFSKKGFQKKHPEAVLLDGPYNVVRLGRIHTLTYVATQNCKVCGMLFTDYRTGVTLNDKLTDSKMKMYASRFANYQEE